VDLDNLLDNGKGKTNININNQAPYTNFVNNANYINPNVNRGSMPMSKLNIISDPMSYGQQYNPYGGQQFYGAPEYQNNQQFNHNMQSINQKNTPFDMS
jgi:hypothetical protein